MQSTLTTNFSLPSVTGTKAAKSDTSFLGVLGSFLKNGTFSSNYSTSRRLNYFAFSHPLQRH